MELINQPAPEVIEEHRKEQLGKILEQRGWCGGCGDLVLVGRVHLYVCRSAK